MVNSLIPMSEVSSGFSGDGGKGGPISEAKPSIRGTELPREMMVHWRRLFSMRQLLFIGSLITFSENSARSYTTHEVTLE